MRVHVVGNACIDTTFRLGRFPSPGETLNASTVSEGLGGKGANQAVAASRTGAPVTLWTALGRDTTGATISGALAGENLDLKVSAFDLPSDRSTIMVDATGENLIVSGVACAKSFDPLCQAEISAGIEPDDILVLQGNLTTPATERCLRAARERGAKTVLNLSPINEFSLPHLAFTDILVVNRSEAQTIAEQLDIDRAALNLASSGPAMVVVTLGPEGCIWLRADETTIHRLPAPAITAVDTSGAGDVFCGAFVGALSLGMAIPDSLRFALAAASVAVTRPGTLASCPTSSEMAALLDRTKANHHG
ncbi:ribokinase [Mesorhizobium sp. CN2-181]|uniref:ribokinase n=1 Tax=Mesorhizobium yinganensis TaxID=3157707 RepID=UPI0032B874F9